MKSYTIFSKELPEMMEKKLNGKNTNQVKNLKIGIELLENELLLN